MFEVKRQGGGVEAKWAPGSHGGLVGSRSVQPVGNSRLMMIKEEEAAWKTVL